MLLSRQTSSHESIGYGVLLKEIVWSYKSAILFTGSTSVRLPNSGRPGGYGIGVDMAAEVEMVNVKRKSKCRVEIFYTQDKGVNKHLGLPIIKSK